MKRRIGLWRGHALSLDRHLPPSMTGFQRLCLATTALVFVLIVIGGTVRATDSGLGCPDWPRCHGSFIPRWETHTLIEYSHRLTASVAGLMVLGVAVWAWRSYRHVRAIAFPAAATFVLLLVQGGLGGLTVIHELPPEIVTVHLATALTLFALLLLISVAAFQPDASGRIERASHASSKLLLTALGLTMAVMLLGAYIAGEGYSLACNGWPLCNGSVVPNMSAESVQLVMVHRVLAMALGLTLVALALRGAAVRLPGTAVDVAGLAFLVYVVQALVGASNIWTEVSDLAQIAHLGVGTALWGLLSYAGIRAFRVPALIEGWAEARTVPAPGIARAAR